MKDRVVCIAQFKGLSITNTDPYGLRPVKGEIYTVVRMYQAEGKKGLMCYQLKELHPNDGWNVEKFRPIDDTFGEWVEETIMKEVQIEELIND